MEIKNSEYIESQIHCHECDRYVTIKIHETETGNLTVDCPVCEHKHYRYVESGRITEQRWRSSSGSIQTVYYNIVSYSSTGTAATYSNANNSADTTASFDMWTSY